MDERKDDVLKMTNEEYRASSPDYGELIIEIVHKIQNQNVLKKIYTVAKTYYELMQE